MVRGQRLPATATVRAGIATAACLVVLVELERLVSGAVSPSGLSRSLSGLLGPAGAWRRSAWDVWLASTATDAVVRVLVVHVVVDVGFVVVYGWLLRRWVRYLRRVAAPPTTGGRRWTVTRVVAVAAVAVAGLDLIEDVFLLVAAGQLTDGPVPGAPRVALATATSGKWIAVAVLAGASWVAARRRLGRGPGAPLPPVTRARASAVALLRALAYQRLSVVVVLLVGVLSVVPAPNIWDQLPDVQRRWVDGRPADLTHLVLALVGTVVLSTQLLVLGRRRADRARATYADGAVPGERTPWWLWGAWPALTLGAVALLVVTGNRDLVDARPLLAFLGTWAAVLGLSALVGAGRFAPPPVGARAPDAVHARRVRVVGDTLAGAVPVLAGLGLIRSFTAPLALRPLDPGAGSLAATVADGALLGWGRWGLQLTLWLLGLALALVTPSLVGWLDGREVPRGRRASSRPGPLTGVVWAVAVLVLVAFAVLPLQVAPAVGVVFTLQAVLGAWVVVVGLAVVRLQESQPLAVFRLLRLRATPVLTLLVLMPVLTSQRGGDADLHAVRTVRSTAAEAARPDVEQALARWVAGSSACDRPGVGPEDPAIRPVVLVAAAGGGVRAVTWTASVLQELGGSACGRVATWLSSGVSGGALGLAVSRRDPGGGEPVSAAGALSAPDALSAAIAGLFVGDLVAGATGVRVPPAGADGRWLDRAGLIETTWERQVPALAETFGAVPAGTGGALLLNATAAGPGCRVLLSQVAVAGAVAGDAGALAASGVEDPALAPAGVADEPSCRVRSTRPPVTLDLREVTGECTPGMSWATASLVSARFPTLTPAARVQGCGTAPLQLVDGGYAESTGLGTLSDLAPDLMAAVRSHNAAALAGSGDPVLAPVVVLLENAPRADVAAPAAGLAAELLVPLAGLGARTLQTDEIAWLQRLSRSVPAACPEPASAACTAAVRRVQGPLTGGVVVVAPQTQPAVDAPLGWTLSVDSRVRLAEAVGVQAAPSCADRPRPGGYACLGQLLDVLG